MTDNPLMAKPARVDDQVVTRKIMEERLVVPIRGKLADMQAIFALTPVADFIWERLDGQKTLADILEEIVAEFNVEREQAANDLLEFVAELSKEKLVTMK